MQMHCRLQKKYKDIIPYLRHIVKLFFTYRRIRKNASR